MTMNAYRYFAVMGVMALAGCSSKGSPQSATDDAGPTTDPLAAELCPPACAAVKTCRPAADLDACRSQCTKELAGNGYLNPDFAKEYVRALSSMDGGQSCGTMLFHPWEGDPFSGTPYDAGDHDAAVLRACVDNYGTCVGAPRSIADSICFTFYYVWNTNYRDAMDACWKQPCPQQPACLSHARAPLCGMPWLAIPPDPNSLLDMNCLPRDAGGL